MILPFLRNRVILYLQEFPRRHGCPLGCLRSWDTTDICDILRLRRDDSTSKLQCTTFLKLGSHYQRVSLQKW